MLVPALIAAFGLGSAGRATAQTFTSLYTFTNGSGTTISSLVLSGSTLYGTRSSSGESDWGSLFKINVDGKGFKDLYDFTGNEDGANPKAGLVLLGNRLYGTTAAGGSNYTGAIFAINTNGSGFTSLYNFSGAPFPDQTNSDGAYPMAGLILSGGTLYGTASGGGTGANGTVFKINTNGTGFTTLYSFSALDSDAHTNTDGAYPAAGLLLSGNTLYGTTSHGGGGGIGGNGTVFKILTNGTGFTNLYSFTADNYPDYTNSDGAGPVASLVLSGNTLYGTAEYGGTSSAGTVFAIHTDGTGFTNLHNFAGTFDDGAWPIAELLLSGSTLYGTTSYSGSWSDGTLFKLSTDGTGFTNLHMFTGLSDGAAPDAGLILSGNTLYGSTELGAYGGEGTVFSQTLGSGGTGSSTPLFYSRAGSNLIFSWTNANFSLQSAPTVTGSYGTISNAISPFTNSIVNTQKFFRLIAN